MECGLYIGRIVSTKASFSGKPKIIGPYRRPCNVKIQASTEVAQLEVICKSCGIPDAATWPELPKLKYFKTMVHPLVGRFHPKPRRQIREIFCALPNDSVDLLDSLLRLNPTKRLSSNDAVQGKYIFC